MTSRNGAAVIVFPGSASRARQARFLVRHGYGVLMLDMRGYAASEGDPNMFGWEATKDVDAGIAFLRRRHDVEAGRIGGIGYSVGGEVMLEAAATNSSLAAVIADGARRAVGPGIGTSRAERMAVLAWLCGADSSSGHPQR